MEKLKMHSPNKVEENIKKIEELFPNCVTERIVGYKDVVRADGTKEPILEKAIDFDMLKQELSSVVVEGPEERYQFTWPDKKKSILLANAPISATLRPCREESVDFDTTENLYIEGDNLDVLKLLQETYLGKIKMIYIDPPYNTGGDFVYEDDFAESTEEYLANSGQYDREGNRLVQNMESKGRFHTDWLNMIYPRLKIAKNLLSDGGAIFIHIDEHEVYTLQMICNEVFGKKNELGSIIWDKRNPKGSVAGVAYQHETILVYCKNIVEFAGVPFTKKKEHADEMIAKANSLIKRYGCVNEQVRAEYKNYINKNKNEFSGGEIAYSLIDDKGRIYQPVSMAAPDKPETRSHRPLIHPRTGKPCPVPEKGWRFTDKKMDELVAAEKIEYGPDETTQPRQKYYLTENLYEAVSSLLYYGGSDDAMGLPFENPKPLYVAKRIISSLVKNDGEIIMDFFSGSATTAHATMQLNLEDRINRHYIMVQIPEIVPENKLAYKQGYKTICEIGKERIRRAGAKIKNESQLAAGFDNLQVKMAYQDDILKAGSPAVKDLDVGFRVLKLDSSNMKDVYYNPADYTPTMFESLADNIKEDRSPEDLLFQVMLDLGILLSSKIEETTIAGKKVFSVADKFLIACFDADLTDEVITEIAKQKPYYFVTRDHSMASDSVATNFEQIFATYSPDTVRKVL